MKEEERLLSDILEVLRTVKSLLPYDFAANRIQPLIIRIKERIYELDIKNLDRIRKNSPSYQDTEPSNNVSILSNFPIFEEVLKGPKCHLRPSAEHKHLRDLSESLGKYVCSCDFYDRD